MAYLNNGAMAEATTAVDDSIRRMQMGFPRPTVVIQPMAKEIAEAIQSVMKTVKGIEKKGKNEHFRYKFAKVGDLMAELQPAMADAGLIIMQHEVSAREIDGALAVTYVFFLAHSSGQVWNTGIIHTGMATMRNSKGGIDDKAYNKCHTAARKYFMLGLFHTPVLEEGELTLYDGDADEQPNTPPQRPSDLRARYSRFITALKDTGSEEEAAEIWRKGGDLLKEIPNHTMMDLVDGYKRVHGKAPPAIYGIVYERDAA